MPEYYVDEELALRVERLARRKPFENLAFNDALRRVLDEKIATVSKAKKNSLEDLIAEGALYQSKKAPSPKPIEWVKKIPELKDKGPFSSWKSVCVYLHINTVGDSARRRLKKWVEINRPDWPEVPDI